MVRVAFRTSTVAVDVLLAAAAFVIAYALAPLKISALSLGVPALTLIQLVVLYAALAAGFSVLFRRELSPWRYVSIPDVLVLGRVAVLTAGLFLLWVFVLDRARGVPRSTLVVAPLVQMMACVGVRVLRRALYEGAIPAPSPRRSAANRGAQAPFLLLIGPASLADTYLRDAARNHDQSFTPVGIIGVDRRDVGQQVRGVCILETLENLDAALADLRRWNRYPRAVLFLEEPARLKGLTAAQLGNLKSDGVKLLRLPSIVELAHDEGANLVAVREIKIEELLPRDPIELDRVAVGALIRGRRVLVTGAGGSIGSELCRQVAAFRCAHLTLLDFSEAALFGIEREIQETHPEISCSAALCDVRRADRLTAIFREQKPDLVFHAAALKHVLMVERHPCEGVLTNVVGTWNVAEASKACGAAQMVLISTDKAVDPSSVMGATKRLAESMIQAQQSTSDEGTSFTAVRFGNVLGSAGSVVPIFKSQIERGGPVTVTHPEMARFFMTIQEAAQLVLHATATSAERRGGPARLFLLEMGKPVRIMDLARQMIALSGLKPGKDIELKITGLRPGEKLTESLLDETETTTPCAPKVLEVVSSAAARFTGHHFAELKAMAERGETEATRQALFDIVALIRGPRAGSAPNLRVVARG